MEVDTLAPAMLSGGRPLNTASFPTNPWLPDTGSFFSGADDVSLVAQWLMI